MRTPIAARLATITGVAFGVENLMTPDDALIRAIGRAASDLEEVAERKNLRAFERFAAIAEVNFGEAELTALEAKGYRLPR